MISKIGKFLEEPRVVFAPLKGLNPNHLYHCLSIKRLLKNKNISMLIDVGANKGEYIDCCRYVFKNIDAVAFEPILYLHKNISLKKNVQSYNMGLFDKNIEEKEFFFNTKKPSRSSFFQYGEDNSLSKNEETKKISACVKRFDSLGIRIKRPCLLKIDVEGSELEVIKGFGDLLKKIDIVQLEFHFVKSFNKNDASLSNITKVLEENGFRSMVQKSLRYYKGKPLQCDLIFSR